MANVPETDEVFQDVSTALAPNFHMIGPNGVLTAQPELLDGLRKAYGCHEKKKRRFQIEIKNCQSLFGDGDICLMSYEEWQRVTENLCDEEVEETARISTVLFRECEGCHNGVQWMHVHETWKCNSAQ